MKSLGVVPALRIENNIILTEEDHLHVLEQVQFIVTELNHVILFTLLYH